MRNAFRWLPAVALAVALASPTVAFAQDQGQAELKGYWLTTTFPEQTIKAGSKAEIRLTLRNVKMPPQRATLGVYGLPGGWKWAIKGGGRDVAAAIVDPNDTTSLTLELTPPAGAKTGSAAFEVRADLGGQSLTLPMKVTLSEQQAGGVELEPELPGLRGSPKSTFSYKVAVRNYSAEDALFSLAAKVPEGFQATFKRGYGAEEITGLPIKAGQSETVTIEVKSASGAAAGRYPVQFAVQGGGQAASTDLVMEVTGTPQVRLIGPGQRLSGEAVAGEEKVFTFTVGNAGTAPARGITIALQAPNGWEVSSNPDQIDTIDPGETAAVSVSIKPVKDAIAGDYVVVVGANGEHIAETVNFRVAVRTSTMWGAVSAGIIAAAVLVLGLAVMRYGRR